ncbi:putative Fe-S cluster [uncultured Desulfobacterium sp.]|uniref:Putative Fe-S cluster n=1 Tax=uncultured Desulfobacterium sp. TaxID=201089 RepID=A0A445N3Q2_9BACT|nr:putative Fe-S cluster [uncultured Desulfobacterium sp.]
MLLKTYTKEIFRAKCNPGFQNVHCIAHLDQDIGEVIPFLNAELGGFEYYNDPPAVTFKNQGRLITVHPDKIAINALEDEAEAEKILEWLKREINETWEKRAEITPSYKSAPRPQIIEILKLLPKTSCRECGQPTCMVFSTLVAEGAKGPGDCPQLIGENKTKLDEYLNKFNFEV